MVASQRAILNIGLLGKSKSRLEFTAKEGICKQLSMLSTDCFAKLSHLSTFLALAHSTKDFIPTNSNEPFSTRQSNNFNNDRRPTNPLTYPANQASQQPA